MKEVIQNKDGHWEFGERRNVIVKYRSKPVEIEAIQWRYNTLNPNENNFQNIKSFCKDAVLDYWMGLIIPTLEGDMKANNHDWIIKGTIGEFYPCKDEVFKKKYEALDGK